MKRFPLLLCLWVTFPLSALSDTLRIAGSDLLTQPLKGFIETYSGDHDEPLSLELVGKSGRA